MDAALQYIQSVLEYAGRSSSDFGMFLPAGFDAEAFRLTELRDELPYNAAADSAQAERMAAQFNNE